MAIAQVIPQANRNPGQQVVSIKRDTLHENYVDNDVTPAQSLLPYITGTPWNLHAYYHQLVGEHTDLEQLDSATGASHQTYEVIYGLPIHLSSGLSHAFNDTSTLSEVTGEALVGYGIVPNKHDMFLAQAGNYRIGLYQVKTVERMTYDRQSVYTITYTLIGVDNEAEASIATLKSRVVREYHHDKQRAVDGLQSVITVPEYQQRLDIQRLLAYHTNNYLNKYFVIGVDNVLLPDQAFRIYDPDLFRFIHKVLALSSNPLYSHLSPITLTQDINQVNTLYKVLLDRESLGLATCAITRKLLPLKYRRSKQGNYSDMYDLKYLNIDYLVVTEELRPYKTDTNIEGFTTQNVISVSEVNGLGFLSHKVMTLEGIQVPLYPTFSLFDSYLLPKSFYLNQGTCSVLERQLLRAIRREAIASVELHQLLSTIHELPTVVQFYYFPLVAYLATVYLRT